MEEKKVSFKECIRSPTIPQKCCLCRHRHIGNRRDIIECGLCGKSVCQNCIYAFTICDDCHKNQEQNTLFSQSFVTNFLE